MSEQIDKVYSPATMHLAKFGFFTSLFLRLFVWTTYIHETPYGVVVYKKCGTTMYILGATRKPSQAEQAGLS